MTQTQLHEMTENELRELSQRALRGDNKVVVNQVYAELGWRQ